jgi:hypothetical protein
VPTRENLSKDIEIKVIPNKKPIELFAAAPGVEKHNSPDYLDLW